MAKIIYDTSEETRARELARLREKALHDEASALKDATDKGIAIGEERGIEKGKAEARNEMIEKMRAKGYSEEQIKDIIS